MLVIETSNNTASARMIFFMFITPFLLFVDTS